jgi:hypothetical protein
MQLPGDMSAAAFLIVPIVIAITVMGFSYLKKGRAASIQYWGAHSEGDGIIDKSDIAVKEPSDIGISPESPDFHLGAISYLLW